MRFLGTMVQMLESSEKCFAFVLKIIGTWLPAKKVLDI